MELSRLSGPLEASAAPSARMYTMYMSDVLSPTFPTVALARKEFKNVLDLAETGTAVTIQRDGFTAAVVPVDELRELLAHSVAADVEVGVEDGRWFAIMPGRPFGADGASQDEAIQDLIDALREYVVDWHADLRTAPNHRAYRNLAQLVELSTDGQLREWFTA